MRKLQLVGQIVLPNLAGWHASNVEQKQLLQNDRVPRAVRKLYATPIIIVPQQFHSGTYAAAVKTESAALKDVCYCTNDATHGRDLAP